MQRRSKQNSMEKQPSNRAENQIRPFTVGRKNRLFSDTPAGAKASAVIYSIVEVDREVETVRIWIPCQTS